MFFRGNGLKTGFYLFHFRVWMRNIFHATGVGKMNTRIKKCKLVADRRVEVLWYARAILRRSKHWSNAPRDTTFNHRLTEALNGGKMEICEKHQTI